MSFIEKDGLRYYQFELLESEKLVQGIFTRKGGISPSPWDSLNLGGTVGDSRENTIENRLRLFNTVGRRVNSLFDVWQVHGKEIVCSSVPRPLETPHQKADGIFTDNSEITLLMRFADCVPIFMYDPIQKVAGIVHAGWQGTVKKIAQVAVQIMKEKYNSQPENILAGIGPSIGPDHYEIGKDVVEKVQLAFAGDATGLLRRDNEKMYFDLWTANSLTLQQAGVKNIQISGICTACNPEDWYSHRGENGKTGRFAAILAIKKEENG